MVRSSGSAVRSPGKPPEGARSTDHLPRFIISAARPEQFPPETDAEVAFLGRSNVGKSSLLNALLGADGLARMSARPGCTQLINFYQVDGGFRFVDLPGYGFAKVPQEISSQWKALIEHYLLERTVLRLSVIVLDARRGWMEKDVELTKKTREYNLNTSMKNYIDPRIYKMWCDYVGLDWEKLYSKSLQKKFSWVSQSKKKWTEESVTATPNPGPSPQ